jgi:hypothetical protein
MNAFGIAIFAYASHHNYPGGVALWKLHQQELHAVARSHVQSNPAVVHIDVAAAQQVSTAAQFHDNSSSTNHCSGRFSLLATGSAGQTALELLQARKHNRFLTFSLLHQRICVASWLFDHRNSERFPSHDALFK